MKNQSNPLFMQTEVIIQDFEKKQILCMKSKPFNTVCLNKICQKYAIMCKDQNCQCHVEHIDCLDISAQKFYKKLQSKMFEPKQLRQSFNLNFEKSIDKLSDLKEDFANELSKQQCKLINLSETQKQLVNAFSKGKTQNFTGKKIWQYVMTFQEQQFKQKTSQRIQVLQAKFYEFLRRLDEQIIVAGQQILAELKNLIKQNDNETKHILQLQKQRVNLFSQSKIIQKQQVETLMNFFEEKKKINSIKLLFTASQNQFQIKKFHQKCDHIPNNMIICLTQFGKIIGGFTPLAWFKPETSMFQKDDSGQSFLFSLTHNVKYSLIDNQKAIYLRSCNDYGPAFGLGSDLKISDKSNSNTLSSSYIQRSYTNKLYRSGDKKQFEMFHGSPFASAGYSVKQWEVWQIQFVQKQ